MVNTDTVVGILGATLLVGVMAGVFLYEARAPVDDPRVDPDEAFLVRYPFLDPDEDIDGDGVQNADDPDLDGDGVPNEEDDTVAPRFSMTGTVGPDPGPAAENRFSMGFPAGTGNRHMVAEARYDAVLTAPVLQPDLRAEMELADGEVRTAAFEVVGGAAVATFELGAIPVGETVLRVLSNDGSGFQADVALEATIHYGPAEG